MARHITLLDYCPRGPVHDNAKYSLIDGMWYCVMSGLILPFIGIYAMRWGADDYMIGLLTSLPALAGLLGQLPGAYYAGRTNSLKQLVIRSGFLFRAQFLLFVFLPLLPVPGLMKAWIFIIVYALANFPGTICGVAWQAMMGEMFPSSLRGQIFGERNMLTGLVTLVFTWSAGIFFDHTQRAFPWNYSLAFAISFIGLMMSLYSLTKLREERPASVRERRASGEADFSFRRFAGVMRNRVFMFFTVGMLIFHFGFHIPASLFTILWVRVLRLPEGWIGSFSVVAGLASVLVYRWLGRLADRRGHGVILLASLFGYLLLPIAYAYAYNPYLICVLQAVGGVAAAAFNLCLFNTLLEMAPEHARADYLAVFNLLMGASATVMPMIGVTLMKLTSITAVMYVASGIRVVGIAWLLMTTFRNVRLRRPRLAA
jgi:MFS family permease